MNKKSFLKALNSAYRLLAVKDRSERELAGRLSAKGFTREGVYKAIEHLKKEGLVDDARFARKWIADCMALRPRGPLAIKDELTKKGLEKDLIVAIMGDDSTGYNEYDLARSLAEKKISESDSRDSYKRRKTVYGYLARRGFSFDVINDILDRM